MIKYNIQYVCDICGATRYDSNEKHAVGAQFLNPFPPEGWSMIEYSPQGSAVLCAKCWGRAWTELEMEKSK